MTEWWQHFPERINPIAFSFGVVSVRWYAVMYLIGIVMSLYFLTYRLQSEGIYRKEDFWDMALFVVASIFLGSRLGYVFLYDWEYFSTHVGEIFLPLQNGLGVWTGLMGMSFHGGLVGAVVGLWFFTLWKKLPFWLWADRLVLCAPIGIFFGRIGNFLNGELFGRVTSYEWGMIFPTAIPAGVARYPSQLVEAFLEGVVLFLLLRWVSRRYSQSGTVSVAFLVGYGCIRFVGEWFREPDPQIGFIMWNMLTLGQVLSLGMILCGIMIWPFLSQRAILGATGQVRL